MNPLQQFIQSSVGSAFQPAGNVMSTYSALTKKPRQQFEAGLQSKPIGTPTSPYSSSSATAPVASSPAKAQFVNNLASAQQGAVSSLPGYRTMEFKKGVDDASKFADPATPGGYTINPLTSGNVQTPSGATVNAGTGALVGGAPKADPRASYEAAFRDYIASLQPDSELEASRKRLSEMTLGSEKAQADALYAPGDTVTGANLEAGNIERNRSFGIRAEADRLEALTGRRSALTEAQKARLEFEKSMLPEPEKDPEGFSISEGQSRYVYDPVTGQYKEIASKGKTYAPKSPGDDTPSAQELKVFINKQIATPEFQALTDEEKALYIQSQGGTPYDYGY